ncbi:MAG: hypothetical protein DSM106950_26525 [Stigonema ocellatum SAG 48.90 = DSM 106950]|nr:hypothetical protein [Stigonema ocellatum SAG 48.90 = DSM 106950]
MSQKSSLMFDLFKNRGFIPCGEKFFYPSLSPLPFPLFPFSVKVEMVKIISDIENNLEIAELKAEILSKLNQGEVLFDIKQLIFDEPIESDVNLTSIIDLFVTQFGYSPLGVRWKEINQEEAKKL